MVYRGSVNSVVYNQKATGRNFYLNGTEFGYNELSNFNMFRETFFLFFEISTPFLPKIGVFKGL